MPKYHWSPRFEWQLLATVVVLLAGVAVYLLAVRKLTPTNLLQTLTTVSVYGALFGVGRFLFPKAYLAGGATTETETVQEHADLPWTLAVAGCVLVLAGSYAVGWLFHLI